MSTAALTAPRRAAAPHETSTADIRRELADGQTVAKLQVSTGWPRQQIQSVISGTRGWLLDPATDTVFMLGKGDKPVPAQMPGTLAVAQSRTVKKSVYSPAAYQKKASKPTPAAARPAEAPVLVVAPEPVAASFPAEPDPVPDALVVAAAPVLVRKTTVAAEPELPLKWSGISLPNISVPHLLENALAFDDPAVRRDLGKAVAAINELNATVSAFVKRQEAAEIAKYEQDVADLTNALAAAEERLRVARGEGPLVVASKTPPARVVDTVAVRSWALKQGLKCKDRGRIPAAIQDQYDAAHPITNR